MHVNLIKDRLAADSRCVAHGDTPDCVEVTFEVALDKRPNSVWLSMFFDIYKRTEPFAMRHFAVRADRVRFTCRGDEVECAFEALKHLVMQANAVFYDPEDAEATADMVVDRDEKERGDKEFTQRAKRLL